MSQIDDMKKLANRINNQELLPSYLKDTLEHIADLKNKLQELLDYPKNFPDYSEATDTNLLMRRSRIDILNKWILLLQQDAWQMNEKLR